MNSLPTFNKLLLKFVLLFFFSQIRAGIIEQVSSTANLTGNVVSIKQVAGTLADATETPDEVSSHSQVKCCH